MPSPGKQPSIWDERYSVEEYIFGKAPNVFFRDQLAKLTPGTLLLPAEGEGRNAVYAAEQGWIVTAFDRSVRGQTKAFALAAERGVTIDYTIAGFDTAAYEPEQFDAIALIYAHLHNDLRRTVHHKLIQWLKPGGTFILEAYSKEQLRYKTGGPSDVNALYSVAEIGEDFASLEIRLLEEVVAIVQEGPAHSGQASVIRLVARKPLPA